jgi:ferrochelatase
MVLDYIDSWHTLPPYVGGLVDSIAASRMGLTSSAEARAHVIFSAHSLPKAALLPDDPYEQQLRETAEKVAEQLELPPDTWTLAYQSASGLAQDWLGPLVTEVIVELAARGVREVVLCPFGFVADQPEILYDLDLVTFQMAKDLGVTIARTPLLNDGTAVIDSLTLLVERWTG